MITFAELNDISEWSMRSVETRYCPLTEREYTITRRFWPSINMREGYFRTYVN